MFSCRITGSDYDCSASQPVGLSATKNSTPENSHQSHEQANKRKKARTHEFKSIIAYVLEAEGERDLIKSIEYMI